MKNKYLLNASADKIWASLKTIPPLAAECHRMSTAFRSDAEP